jgi:hypothetical protein
MEKLNKLKIVSGHQPAYLPWLGYFHKILISDEFIYMDTVQYSRGWINKNIINGKNNQTTLSVPLIKADKFEEINKLKIKYSAKDNWKEKHLNSIYFNYKKCDHFEKIYKEIEKIYNENFIYLNDLCYSLLKFFLKYLSIDTKIIKMSENQFEGKKDKLLLSHALQTKSDILFVGNQGKDYIDEKIFDEEKILITYQNYICNEYSQLSNNFFEKCSIIDLIMNIGKNSKEIILKNNLTKKDLENKYFEKFK